MSLTDGSFFIAFIAGLLTMLSPCVLPVLPLIVGSSANKDRLSPLFVCAGLAMAFVVFGWSVAAFGTFLGLKSEFLRMLSAGLLGIFGIVFISEWLTSRINMLLQPLSNRAHGTLSGIDGGSRSAHLAIGFLLGAVWTPCSGPTLGTAISLAARDAAGIRSLVTMSFFALGAVLPLFVVAYGAGGILRRNQFKVFILVSHTKKILGSFMILISVLILTGLDKSLETRILTVLPDSWIDLTVRY